MRRNRSTDTAFRLALEPLTRRILARMGPKGLEIRQRLSRIYQERGDLDETLAESQPREN